MLRNFLKLISGNSLAQAIQLAALLFLTKIYQPEDFGILGKVQSISAILVIISTLQLQYVIPLSKKEAEAESSTNIIFSLLCYISLFSFFIAYFLSFEYSIAIILSCVLGIVNILTNYIIYKGQFGSLSVIFIIRALSIVVLQLLFFFLKIENGLIFGAICGEFISMIGLVVSKKLYFMFNIFSVKIADIWNLVKDWKPYSLYGTIQEVLSVMVYSLPIIFYVDKFGDNIGGQFSMAYRIIWAPTVLISSSLAQLLTHKFGQENDFTFLKSIFWFDKRLIILVVLGVIGLNYTNFINELYLGGKWNITFLLFPYMFINAVFFLFANPYRVALRVKKLNVVILVVEIITLLAITALFYYFEADVVTFTAAICSISVLQNMLIVLGYYFRKEKDIEKTL
ncbi:MAG TPA: hypothetical protein DCG88_09730 [Sphingobacterium sp.]|nr:hypothetical protein [Sphingobacterium sp.]